MILSSAFAAFASFCGPSSTHSAFCAFLRLFADQMVAPQGSATHRQFVIGQSSFVKWYFSRRNTPRGQNETIGHQQLTTRKMVQYHFPAMARDLASDPRPHFHHSSFHPRS